MKWQQSIYLLAVLGVLGALGGPSLAAAGRTPVGFPAKLTPSGLPVCTAWSASSIYTLGNYTVLNRAVWRARWWSQNDTPGVAPVWEARPATECSAGSGSGSSSTTTSGVPSLAQAQAAETSKTADPALQRIKASVRTLDAAAVAAVQPGRSANPDNVKRIEKLVNATDWLTLFPLRDASYSYLNFLQAMAKFPAVCDSYVDGRNADLNCRKTLATMFAHFAQETGAHNSGSAIPQWRQGLVYNREAGCSETGPGCLYNAECNTLGGQTQAWPCGKQANGAWKKYFGRGAKQLSYNYNYGPFSDAMYGSVNTLLDKPELVADTWLNLASAVFFYIYPQPPKPSMLFVVDGSWQPNAADQAANISAGFGATINIINGGIECGSGANSAQALNRTSYYQFLVGFFVVPVDRNENLGCAKMTAFPASGAGAQAINWEQDWRYDPTHTDGKTYACQLVSYQTAYSALKAGDYVRCVEHNFNVVLK